MILHKGNTMKKIEERIAERLGKQEEEKVDEKTSFDDFGDPLGEVGNFDSYMKIAKKYSKMIHKDVKKIAKGTVGPDKMLANDVYNAILRVTFNRR